MAPSLNRRRGTPRQCLQPYVVDVLGRHHVDHPSSCPSSGFGGPTRRERVAQLHCGNAAFASTPDGVTVVSHTT